MTTDLNATPDVGALLKTAGVDAWGVAANDPPLPRAPGLPTAISLLARFTPEELAGVEDGPTPAYYAGYCRVNDTLNAAAAALADALVAAGFHAETVPATVPEEDYDAIDDWCAVPVFAHKTAATRAGLGWIGKTALFVSPTLGPRVRLATVFTDLPLAAESPVEDGRCGSCRKCVDACPAGAGRDVTWRAGMPRADLYDAKACEIETEKHPDLGGVCGVCIAVCPWGRRDTARDPVTEETR
jgi:epoxyqueuosine reductase QueG